jgi:hypothetical protein
MKADSVLLKISQYKIRIRILLDMRIRIKISFRYVKPYLKISMRIFNSSTCFKRALLAFICTNPNLHILPKTSFIENMGRPT